MIVEGVPYSRYIVRYVTSDGKRRRKVLWCPGDAWVRDTVHRWVSCADIDVKKGSNVRISHGT